MGRTAAYWKTWKGSGKNAMAKRNDPYENYPTSWREYQRDNDRVLIRTVSPFELELYCTVCETRLMAETKAKDYGNQMITFFETHGECSHD